MSGHVESRWWYRLAIVAVAFAYIVVAINDERVAASENLQEVRR